MIGLPQVTMLPGSTGSSMFLMGVGGLARPWDFGDWKRESLSWKTGSYIHSGLSGKGGQYVFRGPDVVEFFSRISVNGFKNFPVGASKHAVMCDEAGLIASHGVLRRNDEEEVQLFVAGPWAAYQLGKTSLRVEYEVLDNFLFQVAGPTSIDVLEKATGENLRDIAFLKCRKASVAGRAVEIMRVGMAGTLAYELQGASADGDAVYDAVVLAGEGHGLERLGWRTYLLNHIEAGFPQQVWTFFPSVGEDAGFRAWSMAANPMGGPPLTVTGSVDPQDMRARYRNPWETGWEKMIKFDHDFLGREALAAEALAPKRRIVTLAWNSDDVIDIHASLFREGPTYKTMDLPTAPHGIEMLAHADHVMKDGRSIGYSSGTAYSYFFRKVLSHCIVDVADAEVGNEVIVQWGDFGGTIKDVRATVAPYPFLNIGRNQDVDVAAKPPLS